MPTVVDALIVTLGLDAKNFTDEQKKALEAFNKSQDEVDKRLKQLEERNKKSAQSFGDTARAAEGLFTVVAGAGLISFARDTVTAAAGAGRMATNIGIASNELSAFTRMIERNGGSADAAAGSLKGFVDQTQRAKWGQASPDWLLGMSQIGAGLEDGPIQAYMKLARFAEKNSVQDVNLAGQRLGFSQDIINSALKGGAKAMEEYRKASEGAISPEQTKQLTDLQKEWVRLGQTITTVGTDVVASAAPATEKAMKAISDWTMANRKLADALATVLTALTAMAAIRPALWLLRLLGLGGVASAATGAVGGVGAAGIAALGGGPVTTGLLAAGMVLAPTDANEGEKNIYENGKLTEYGKRLTGAAGGEPAFGSQREKEAFIRETAAARGISPETAMAVARSEGFNNFRSTIPGEQSFGAFQLHVTPGGRGKAVGDQFQKDTGLDPSDPKNEKASIEYALNWAKQHGWGDFHGAANTGIGKWEGIQRGATTVNVGGVNVTTDSRDPREHGKVVSQEIKTRMSTGDGFANEIATNANTGMRP